MQWRWFPQRASVVRDNKQTSLACMLLQKEFEPYVVAAASSPLRTFLANGKNCPSLGPLTITWHCIGSANHWPHFSLAQPKIDWCNSRNSTILNNTVTIIATFWQKITTLFLFWVILKYDLIWQFKPFLWLEMVKTSIWAIVLCICTTFLSI